MVQAGILTNKIDVSTAGSPANGQLQTSNTGDQFIVSYTALQSTGTGVIQPFLRVQAKGQEQGYNTSGQPVLDDKSGPWTHAIQAKDFDTVTLNGAKYVEFVLDANQIGNGNISVNQVQIFTSDVDPLNHYTLDPASASPANGPPFTSGTEAILHLDASVTNAQEIFRLNNPGLANTSDEIIVSGGHGSGSGDLFFYVSADLFKNATPDSYVTFFTQLGGPAGQDASNSGFEEWSFDDVVGDPLFPNTPAPEPASIAVWGLMGFAGILLARRRKLTNRGERI
jgi:MYXO-CTERM domain-containing protein